MDCSLNSPRSCLKIIDTLRLIEFEGVRHLVGRVHSLVARAFLARLCLHPILRIDRSPAGCTCQVEHSGENQRRAPRLKMIKG